MMLTFVQQQRDSLWFNGHAGLYTIVDALSFTREVGVALRYGAFPEDQKAAHARAFVLTNGVLATGNVIENQSDRRSALSGIRTNTGSHPRA
jgi:hypothetical protein